MNRFSIKNEAVIDKQTGLMWTKDASPFGFPLGWDEALKAIREQNSKNLYGYKDWRLPNRKELFSLISHKAINPSLPPGHPFTNVFNGYYWTSSTCARLPNQAWYIHLGGARVFKGMKYASYMAWPVRSYIDHTSNLFQTGQNICFNESGDIIDCQDTGQDGERQSGLQYPKNRFQEERETIYDNATGLTWLRAANFFNKTVDWKAAFELVAELNKKRESGHNDWRVPNVFELEGLTDIGQYSPALPPDYPFKNVQEFYWSATTSKYDTGYAWVLYMIDGAVGVGYKQLSEFYLWPVRGKEITKIS